MSGLKVSFEGPVARFTLARPDAGNALDLPLALELETAVSQAVEQEVGVVLLDAEGPLFCGGGDVAAMSSAPDPSAYTYQLAGALHRALLAIAEAPLTVVAAVQGPAAGAGLALVLNCDLVIASREATFLAAYAPLGVTPDGGTTHLLPRIVGIRRAASLAMGGHRLTAQEALEWGLVTSLASRDHVEETAMATARRVAETPPEALAETKRLLSRSWLPGYREHLDQERDSIARLIASKDSQERQAEFLSRRR